MLSGVPTIFGIDPYNYETVPSTQLGTIGITADGRKFRYVLNGAVATLAGKMYQGPAEDATNLSPSGGLATAASAVGTNTVTLTGTLTLAANLLAGGYMSVVAGTGATVGQTYKVKGNTAVAGAANCVVTLEENIYGTAFTTASRVVFHRSPYDGILVAPGTLTAAPVGVPLIAIPATTTTTSYYGWVQSGGPVSCLVTGTFASAGLAVGMLVGGTIGSLAPAIAGTNVLGYTMGIAQTGEYDLVNLQID